MTEDETERIISATNDMIFYQNIVATFILVGFIVLIRDRPAKPPSAVALKEPEAINFCENVKILLKNRDYLLTISINIMVDGVFVLFGVIIDPYLEALGYTTTAASIVGGIVVLIGAFAAIMFSVWLDRHHRYLFGLRLLSFGSFVSLAAAYAIFPLTKLYLVCGLGILVGIFLVPMYPMSASYIAESTFPLPESVSLGLMNLCEQLLLFPLGALVSFFFSDGMPFSEYDRTLICNGLFVFMLLIACVCTLFVRERLERTNFSQSHDLIKLKQSETE